MADIHQVISLGIGSPADIPHFLTFGLNIGAAAETVYANTDLDGSYERNTAIDGAYTVNTDIDGGVS